MSLPINLPLAQMQSQWATELNGALQTPILNGLLLSNVSVSNGTTVINHGLGRRLRGWILVGISGAATVYDNQSTNPSPQLTLSLTSNAAVTASLWVF